MHSESGPFIGKIATYTNSNGLQVPEGKVWQYVSVTGERYINHSGAYLDYDKPLNARLHIYTNQGGVPIQLNNNTKSSYQQNLVQMNQEQSLKLLQASQMKILQQQAAQKLQPKNGLPQPKLGLDGKNGDTVVMYPNNVPGARIEKVFDRNGKVIGQRIVNAPMPAQQKIIQRSNPTINQVVAPNFPISQN